MKTRLPKRKGAKVSKLRKQRVARKVVKSTMSRVARMEVLRMKETQDADMRTSIFQVGCLGGNQWLLGFQIYAVTPNTSANNGISIAQGDGEGARTGNLIRLTRSSIRFTAVPTVYDPTTNPNPKPFYLCWMVISAKRGIPFNQASNVNAIYTDLYDNGSSTLPATRNTFDFLRPINKDKYVVHKAGRRKIFWEYYNGTGNATLNGGLGANNDFAAAAMVKLDLTKYCPKQIQYVDNSANPASKPVWIVFYTVWADGSEMNVNHAPCQVNLVQDIQFKDM